MFKNKKIIIVLMISIIIIIGIVIGLLLLVEKNKWMFGESEKVVMLSDD